MSAFADEIQMLVARELPQARRDAERISDMIGTLTEVLALTIAVATCNDPRGPNELLEGTAQYLFEGVAEKAPIAVLMRGAG